MMKSAGALAIFAVLLSSCAAPRPEERELAIRPRDLAGDVEAKLLAESSLVTHHVDAPVEHVWAVLPSVYEELEIPLGFYEPEKMVLGNREFNPKTIGGNRMSRYLDCGANTTGGSYADTYQVELYLVTRVDAVGEAKTRIRTEVYATARARDTGGNRIQCPTKGLLERRITEVITEKVGG
jgi:hypothetical protein